MFRPTATLFAALLVTSASFAPSAFAEDDPLQDNTQEGVAKHMQVFKNGSREAMIGGSDKFTGTAYIEPVFPNKEPFAVNAGKVTFLPGGRANWHTHPAGQMIVVTSGKGWVQEEGGEKIVMQPGDVIWTPPGVKHWHGATDTTGVTQYAIQQVKDGKNVEWLEPVTDEQYSGTAQ